MISATPPSPERPIVMEEGAAAVEVEVVGAGLLEMAE